MRNGLKLISSQVWSIADQVKPKQTTGIPRPVGTLHTRVGFKNALIDTLRGTRSQLVLVALIHRSADGSLLLWQHMANEPAWACKGRPLDGTTNNADGPGALLFV
jgi:hypothetical protein